MGRHQQRTGGRVSPCLLAVLMVAMVLISVAVVLPATRPAGRKPD
jgi:hypothetical protein